MSVPRRPRRPRSHWIVPCIFLFLCLSAVATAAEIEEETAETEAEVPPAASNESPSAKNTEAASALFDNSFHGSQIPAATLLILSEGDDEEEEPVSAALIFYDKEERPPSITRPTEPVEIVINEKFHNATLMCTADGYPRPTLEWYKGSTKMMNKTGRVCIYNGNLTLLNIDSLSLGYYQCRASNPLGTSLSQMVVIKEDKLTTDVIKTIQQTTAQSKRALHLVTEGEPFTLVCELSLNKTGHLFGIHWYRERHGGYDQLRDTERVGIDYIGNFHFAHVVKTDADTYTCGVYGLYENRQPGVQMLGAQVVQVVRKENSPDFKPAYIHGKDYIKATLGDTIMLECFFSAKPPAVISWRNSTYHNIPTSTDTRYTELPLGRQLVIYPVTAADEGNFLCTGANHLGTVSKTIVVNVTTPPLALPEGTLRSMTVVDERDVRLRCWTRAAWDEKLETPRWYRNGEPLTMKNVPSMRYMFMHDQRELLIKDVKKDKDTANYQCNTSNSEGYLFFDAYLRVIKHIVITKKPDPMNVINYGDTVDITVRAKGDKCCPINITWFFNGIPITHPTEFEPFQQVARKDKLIFNSSRVSSKDVKATYGFYTTEVSNSYEKVSVGYGIFPEAREVISWWWISLVIIISVFLIIVVVDLKLIISRCNASKKAKVLADKEKPEADSIGESSLNARDDPHNDLV